MANETIKNAISTVIALSLSGACATTLAAEANATPDTQAKPEMSQTMGTTAEQIITLALAPPKLIMKNHPGYSSLPAHAAKSLAVAQLHLLKVKN
jgi:hypothetical protein